MSNLGCDRSAQYLVSLVKIVVDSHLVDHENGLNQYTSEIRGRIRDIFSCDALLLRYQIVSLCGEHEIQIDGAFEEVPYFHDNILLARRTVFNNLLQIGILLCIVEFNSFEIGKFITWNDGLVTLFNHVFGLNYTAPIVFVLEQIENGSFVVAILQEDHLHHRYNFTLEFAEHYIVLLNHIWTIVVKKFEFEIVLHRLVESFQELFVRLWNILAHPHDLLDWR